MKIIEVKPPIIALCYLMAALAAHFLLRSPRIISSDFIFLGFFIWVAGLLLMHAGWKAFRKAGTPLRPTEKPTSFVTEGPFRFTRNPMYLGMTFMLLGIAVGVGSVPLLVVPIVFFFTMNGVFIPYEERKLEEIFQKEYLDYKSRVRRWI